MKMSELSVGDWFYMAYGFSRLRFYVLEVLDDAVLVGNEGWLVSDAKLITENEMRPIFFAGSGKRRWWWRFIPWRDLVCPFSRPRST